MSIKKLNSNQDGTLSRCKKYFPFLYHLAPKRNTGQNNYTTKSSRAFIIIVILSSNHLQVSEIL